MLRRASLLRAARRPTRAAAVALTLTVVLMSSAALASAAVSTTTTTDQPGSGTIAIRMICSYSACTGPTLDAWVLQSDGSPVTTGTVGFEATDQANTAWPWGQSSLDPDGKASTMVPDSAPPGDYTVVAVYRGT